MLDACFAGRVKFFRLRLRIGSEHHRGLRLAAGDRRDDLPEFFGDERQQRMRQAQHRFQYPRQRPARRAQFRPGSVLELHLGQFDIPVAEFIPDEFINRARQQVEAVIGEMLCDLHFRALQLADNPLVSEG